MQKIRIILLLFSLGVAFTSFSQATSPTDFYAGKWEITILGSPRGDVVFQTDLVRTDGKLTGKLVDKADPANGSLKILRVEESATKLIIYFESSQGGEMSMDLTKVDDNTLKGSVYSFDATAKRIK
ncbi:hypothetical protein DYU11_28405 [Fibrisoma montanum]|uniref:Uncharacterized protein n=1 Tax=Fibrisoma montanum TaxID=2305895 RepID=A0A418LYS4_9BACT|nr:hypothetical protein [Fibrisoma montanum]RIV18497.1 hypothetical protein DYU11_28405 [Fibrisoma montanum]